MSKESIPVVGARISDIISVADLMLLVIGVALYLLGALIGNVAYGIGLYVSNLFQNLTNQNVNVFLTPSVTNVGSAVFQIMGVVLIVVAAAHIIYSLIRAIRAGAP